METITSSIERQSKSVWIATRALFYLMMTTWVLSSIFIAVSEDSLLGTVLSVILVLTLIPTFVLSIIHLTKYKQKGLAITALVISSLGLLIFFLVMASLT